MVRAIIIVLIVSSSAFAQCGPQGCQPPQGYWTNGPSQQAVAPPVVDYSKDFQQIDANFTTLTNKIKALEQINDLLQKGQADFQKTQAEQYTKIDSLFQNDKIIDSNANDLKAKIDNRLKDYADQLKKPFDDLKKDIDPLKTTLTTVNQDVTALKTSFSNNSTETTNKFNTISNLIKGAGEATSDIGFLKWLLAANTGGSSIAIGLAIWAIKKRGPQIVKTIYEHIHHIETTPNIQVTPNIPTYVPPNQGTYVPPNQGTYVPQPPAPTTSYPTQGVDPHTAKINAHDNVMTGGVHPVPPIVIQTPPGPQLTNPTVTYVPTESNNFRLAFEEALKLAGKRYPGQTIAFDYVQKLIEQILNGQLKQ